MKRGAADNARCPRRFGTGLLVGAAVLGMLLWLRHRPPSPTDPTVGQRPGLVGSAPANPSAPGQPGSDFKDGELPPVPPPAGASRQTPPRPGVSVISSTPERTVLSFALGDYTLAKAEHLGRQCTRIAAATTHQLKQRDCPALPCFRSTLVVPANAAPRIRILESDHIEVACEAPLPSPGFVPRNQSRTAQFGPVYESAEAYPAEEATLGESFFVRHVRGQGVTLYPFQYLPQRGVLRVYRRLKIEVTMGHADDDLAFPAAFRSAEFRSGSRSLFDNYEEAFSSSTRGANGEASLPEASGPLLVIVAAGLAGQEEDFVLWKRQKGLEVATAVYPTDTGEGSANVASFIRTRYEQNGVVYVVLMGDHGDLPADTTTANPSDTVYSLVSGDDLYHDLFISRISASSGDDLANQLAKIVAYEKTPPASGDWYTQASFVGSDQGALDSAFGLADWQILDEERTQLLGSGFSAVDRIYDPGATEAQIVNAWNQGRSLIYYLGHGLPTSWVTTGLDVGTVGSELNNGRALPFVLNGNCVTGDFTRSGGDCLAEAMMKAGSSTVPAGGIGVVAATTDMDWDPPIVLMRSFTDRLTGDSTATTGALTFFGVQEAMNYCYSTPSEGDAAAELIMEQLHLFGDCTMALRTAPPAAIAVTHAAEVTQGGAFAVSVATASGDPVREATVCLSNADSQSMAKTDAGGAVELNPGIIAADTATLTVTAPNAMTYQVQLAVTGGALQIFSSADATPGFVGTAYEYQHAAIGGLKPYSWRIIAGKEEWMQLDPDTGLLTGTPISPGSFVYTLEVTDADNTAVTQQASLTIGVPVGIGTTKLAGGTVGMPYSQQLVATGSYGPLSFAAPEPDRPYTITTGPSSFATGGQLQAWHGDEMEWNLDLGFDFAFYGQTYTSCRVGDNGYLILAGPSPDDMWDANPDSLAATVMIAPFWTDLLISEEFPEAGIYVDRHSDRLTVRWNGRDFHTPDTDMVNMAVTLFADGHLEFSYGQIRTSNRMVVGISAGNLADYDLIYSHDWNEAVPDYVSGWTDHDGIDLVFNQSLPDGLELSSDGWLSGTPTQAGDFDVTVTVTDALGAMDTATFQLRIVAPSDWTLELLPGWNLISIPLEPANGDVDQLFAEGAVLAAWQWTGNQYEQATTLQPKRGYWLFTQAGAAATLSGVAPTDGQLALTSGWNLFGPLAERPLPSDPAMHSLYWQWTNGCYEQAPSLQPGVGYWGYALEATTLPLD